MQQSLAFIPFCPMALYAIGARRAEMAHLKISDIDIQRMVIPIGSGRGRKDRDVVLSPKLLEALRVYGRALRCKPTNWPFPGNRWHTASYPVTPRSSGRPVSKPPNAPVSSTSKSIPRLWPATLLDAASDPLGDCVQEKTAPHNERCLPLPEEAGSCALRLLFLSSDRPYEPRDSSGKSPPHGKDVPISLTAFPRKN
jgi:Phage integrase family